MLFAENNPHLDFRASIIQSSVAQFQF